MKKRQLKTALKPIINECLKELLFEEGVLSTLINETMKAKGVVMVNKNQQPRQVVAETQKQEEEKPILSNEEKRKLEEAKAILKNSKKLRQFSNIFDDLTDIDTHEKENLEKMLEQTQGARELAKNFSQGAYGEFLKETIERDKAKQKERISNEPSMKWKIEQMKNGNNPQQPSQPQHSTVQSSIPVEPRRLPTGEDGQPLGTIGEFFDPSRDK